MFYEEKQINNLLKCPNCKEELNEPRLLPCCEETICINCVEQLLEKSKNMYANKYKCIICKTVNELPPERKFPNNKFISKIQSEQPKEIYRSELVENLKAYLKGFDSNKLFLNKCVDDGVVLIKEHCMALRNELSKATQSLLQLIQVFSDEYLKQINSYESETTLKLDHIKQVDVKKSTELSEDFYEKWSSYLNNSIIKTSEIELAIGQASELDKKLKYENELLKKLLFDGFLVFESNPKLVQPDLLGNLKFINKKLDQNIDTIICTKTLEGHKEWIRCIKSFSKYRLISGSDDYLIKIWSLETGECLKTLRGHEDSVTCFEYYEDKLISGSWDGSIKIWDLKKNECIKTLLGHSYRVSHLKMYNNKLLSSSWDCQIKVWDVNVGKCIRTLKGHISVIYCLEIFTKDTLISGSVDKTIKFWNLVKGNCFKTFTGHSGGVTDLKSLSTEKFISSSFDCTIKIWNFKDTKCLQTLSGHSKGVFCLKLISNEKLVSGSLDTTIKIWNLKNFQCFRTINGHSDFVLCLELVDEKLLSGSADKTIKLWEV